MMYEISFGEWLSKRRKAFGLTQHDLADQVHCAVVTIRKIEADQRRPSEQIAELIGQILAVPSGEQTAFLRFARGDWQHIPSNEHLPMAESMAEPLAWRTNPALIPFLEPVPHTIFVGRESELKELASILACPEIRLVTLVGAPGVGKSRLASEVARLQGEEFPDGVLSIQAEEIGDPGILETSIVQALCRENSIDRHALEKLKTEIAHKRMLLVLDNIEHLLASITPLVFSLLQGCPQIKIIVTSREPLHLIGELIYHLPPLELPDAGQDDALDVKAIKQFPVLALFETCAREFRPGFSITQENLEDVLAICRYVDGLPLAIELLASRIGLMTPQHLLAHLSGNFVLHSIGPRYLGGYHQTLQCAIDRSYDLLTFEEKRLFTYLSIFQDGFTLDMVEAAFSATPTYHGIADLMSSLLEKSLIHGENSRYSDPSFRMPNLIQLYASEHLKDFDQDAVTPLHIYVPSFITRREAG